jgi:hypothetical protein
MSPMWLRLLPAPFDRKGRIAGGEASIGPAACLGLGALLHHGHAPAQVIAVMQNTKSARLMSGPVSSLFNGAPSTQRS